MTDPRLQRALAILDALDHMVTPDRAMHLARDRNGAFIVRYDSADSGLAPEQHRGTSVRDALAQCVQSNLEDV